MSDFESDCVVQTTIYNWYSKFKVPTLFRYADSGQWDLIPKRCRTHPREAKFVHRYAPKDTALHRLVRAPKSAVDPMAKTDPDIREGVKRLRISAMVALLQASPKQASTADSFGRTPLHLACMNVACSDGAAELLLEVFPRAAAIQDQNGQTPLHILLEENERVPLALIKLFLDMEPHVVDLQDRNGRTPVDIVRHTEKLDLAVVKMLEETRADTDPCDQS